VTKFNRGLIALMSFFEPDSSNELISATITYKGVRSIVSPDQLKSLVISEYYLMIAMFITYKPYSIEGNGAVLTCGKQWHFLVFTINTPRHN
jgi:hypothetical protein